MSQTCARLSVVIPTHDTFALTLSCLETVRREALHLAPGTVEVFVVDDASADGTSDAIRAQFGEVELLRFDESQGFTRSVNRGLERSSGGAILLLNSDTELTPGSLQALLRTLETHPDYGILGARLHFPDLSAQWSGARAPGRAWFFLVASGLAVGWRRRNLTDADSDQPGGHDVTTVDWVTGAALCLRREVFDALGPLDERYRFFGQDLDYCTRARQQGFAVGIAESVRVLHHQGSSDTRGSSGLGAARGALWIEDLVAWAQAHRGRSFAKAATRALKLGLLTRWCLGIQGGELDIDRYTARQAFARSRRHILKS